MTDNTENISAHQEIPKEKGILIIDRLLSAGWTSTLDMCIALYDYACKNGYESSKAPIGLSMVEFYNWLMENGGLFSGRIRSSYFYFMSEIWTSVREGSIDSKKKDLFIESVQITRKNEANYQLSEETLTYLYHGRGVRSLWIYTYKETGYSIREDLRRYKEIETWRSTKTDYKKIEESIRYNPSEALDKYNLIPDPDVIARKCKALFIQELQRALLADTEGNVKRRLETVERLKKTKPEGWMESASNTYLNAIYDSSGIMKDIDIAPIIHHYGSHLMDRKEYSQGQCFLLESLDTIRRLAFAGDEKAKEEYALTLQNLSTLHMLISDYVQAENETIEALDIFRALSQDNDSYNYGVAVLLNTLAGIHVDMRKYDSVEEEYDEAARIFSRLSNEEPTKYLYMLVECISALAKYYYSVGKNDDSIEAFERAMPYWEKLTEKNFDDFAPNKVNAMINYALALQDSGETNRAFSLLNEAIEITQKLNERSPEVYDEELSTAFQNRGLINAEIGEMGDARKDLEIAEEIRRKLVAKDPRAFNIRLAATLDSLANIDSMAGASDNAISKWGEAISLLSIYDTEGNTEQSPSLGKYYSSIGMIYLNRGDKENAIEYFTKAEAYYRNVFDRNSSPQMFEDNFALTLSYLGILYETNEDTQSKAEAYFEESLDIALWFNSCARSRNYSYLILVCCNYAPFLFNQGRYVEAKRLWEQAVSFGEANSSHPLAEQEQQLLDLARENILDAEYRIGHPEQEEYLDDDVSDEEDITSGEDSSKMAITNYSPEEAILAIESTAKEIAKLNKEDVHYRIKCNELYQDSLKYCALAPDSLFLADYITSMCQFFAEGYSFSPVLDIAPTALSIYEVELKEDSLNIPVRIKYVELLYVYCQGLEEYNCNDKQSDVINSAFELMKPFTAKRGDDIAISCIAFSFEILLDYVYCCSGEQGYETSKQILYFYRNVSSPKKSLMCRFLTKAAIAACEQEEYHEAEQCIKEAEELMNDCDLNDMDNCLQLGELYTFKGRYIDKTPLRRQNNYKEYSVDKSLAAFEKAKYYLEKGLDYNPPAFKCKLLELYRSELLCLHVYMSMYVNEELDLCRRILGLMAELTAINEYVFSWRAVDAYLEIVEVLKEIFFPSFYQNVISLEELEKDCANVMSMYSHMESILAVYQKTDQSLYSDYISKVFEGKKELKNELRAAKE